MEKKDLKKIEKIAKGFFKKMTIEVDFEVRRGETENMVSLALRTEEPQFLIGQRGNTLIDIQRMLGRVLRRAVAEDLYLDLDINKYKENKARYLKDLAHDTADRVSLERKERELPAMSSFERRIIHMELAERGDVKTESAGLDEERHIIIKST